MATVKGSDPREVSHDAMSAERTLGRVVKLSPTNVLSYSVFACDSMITPSGINLRQYLSEECNE